MPGPSADNREPPRESPSRPGSTLSSPEATLAAIESAASEALSQLGVGGTRWTTCIGQVEKLANEYVDNLVAQAATSFGDDQIEKLSARIRVRRQALSLSSSKPRTDSRDLETDIGVWRRRFSSCSCHCEQHQECRRNDPVHFSARRHSLFRVDDRLADPAHRLHAAGPIPLSVPLPLSRQDR